jgi:hypothetical protein
MEDRLTARKEQYCQQYTVASLYSLCLLDRLMTSLMLCFSLLSTFSSVATAAAFLTIIAILLCRTRPSPPRAFLPLPVTAEVETDAEVSGAVEGLGLCSGLSGDWQSTRARGRVSCAAAAAGCRAYARSARLPRWRCLPQTSSCYWSRSRHRHCHCRSPGRKLSCSSVPLVEIKRGEEVGGL